MVKEKMPILISKKWLSNHYTCFLCERHIIERYIFPWCSDKWENKNDFEFHFCCGCGAETNIHISHVGALEFEFDDEIKQEIK